MQHCYVIVNQEDVIPCWLIFHACYQPDLDLKRPDTNLICFALYTSSRDRYNIFDNSKYYNAIHYAHCPSPTSENCVIELILHPTSIAEKQSVVKLNTFCSLQDIPMALVVLHFPMKTLPLREVNSGHDCRAQILSKLQAASHGSYHST